MTDLCTVCDGPLDDGRPVQQGLDGDAHADCLEARQDTQDEGEDDL